MIRRDRIHLRIGSRYLNHLAVSLSVIVLVLLGIFVWNFFTVLPPGRTTVVVVDESGATALSFDRERGKLVVIGVPADVRMEGAFGAGQLPILSLLKLEDLDRGKKGLFVKTVGMALGLPVAGLIRVPGTESSKKDAMGALSPFHPWGWQSSDIARLTRFRLWWDWQTIRPDAVWSMELDDAGVFRRTALPDGSQTRIFDIDRFDRASSGRLEVNAVRRDAKRVLLINTTGIPGVGSKVARVLATAGMTVAAVENEAVVQDTCTIHAKKEVWDSASIHFIRSVYACALDEEGNDTRVDMTVRLGQREANDYR